jgi:hypothetical protein
LRAPPTPVFRRPGFGGRNFCRPKGYQNGRSGPNFADLVAVVYRLAGMGFGRRFAAPTWIKCYSGRPCFRHFHEAIMNDDVLNVSVRKFLKKVGITSQREIEQAVRAAVGSGKLKGNEALPARVILTVEGLSLAVEIEGAIELE